ncbi:MAG: FitA-like ribbon-helix-helix domain-containing protein [Desulfobacterales bacterium]
MPTTITVKNIPYDLYELIKQNAAEHRRSINNEVIAIIENAFRSHGIDPEDFLVTVRKLRERTKRIELTDRLINQAKNEGRP